MTEDMLLRPTKVNDARAETTYCARVLTHYLNEFHRRSDHRLVAETVCVVLDLKDDLLDANEVGKISRDVPLLN